MRVVCVVLPELGKPINIGTIGLSMRGTLSHTLPPVLGCWPPTAPSRGDCAVRIDLNSWSFEDKPRRSDCSKCKYDQHASHGVAEVLSSGGSENNCENSGYEQKDDSSYQQPLRLFTLDYELRKTLHGLVSGRRAFKTSFANSHSVGG
jgi:hypothetical protein